MLIGLVGKSCSGKNYVGEILKSMGYEVWDLDLLAHEGLDANMSSIKELFGGDVIIVDNGFPHVSRKALSKKVFREPRLRTALENILYPWLEEQIIAHEKDSSCNGVLFLNGALLRRAGMDKMCKAVIYVESPYEIRLNRALARDSLDKESFDLRETAQTDVDYKENPYACPVFVLQNHSLQEDELKKAELNRQIKGICDRIGITNNQRNESREEE